MAMSKGELLEMVENTITSNGAKEITGASLNAALTAIIEAMGAGGGGASAEEIISDFGGTPLTDEQKAKNAAAYNKAKAAYETGTPLPLFMVELAVVSEGTGDKIVLLASGVGFGKLIMDSDIMVLQLIMNYVGTELVCTVTEDGTCSTSWQ